MPRTLEFEFKTAPVYKKGKDGRNIYSAIASTAALDRDKEVLIPKGVMTDNFMKNPVMLFIHQSRQLTVGKVLSISVTDEAVTFDFEFYDDEMGKALERRYQTGFMNAFSVGFYPKTYVPVWDLPDEVQSIDVTLPDGSKTAVDLSAYPERPYGIIPQWDLWEISPVPIPSNPEALLQRAKTAIVRKFVDGGHSKAAAGLLSGALDETVNKIAYSIDQFMKGLTDDVEVSSVIAYEKSDVVVDTEFDSVSELGNLSMGCTEDNSGDKEKMDWSRFSKAFAWVNTASADQYTGYKLMHHTIQTDKSLALSKYALFDCMAKLLEKGSAVAKSIGSDFDAVYSHLASHYQDIGVTPPEKGIEYTEDQILAIAKGKEPTVAPTNPDPDADPSPPSDSLLKDITSSMEQVVGSKLEELNSALKVRLHVVVRMLEGLDAGITALKKQEPAQTPPVDDTDSKDVLTVLGDLNKLLTEVKV